MSFQDEMKQIFLRVAAGEVELKEWESVVEQQQA